MDNTDKILKKLTETKDLAEKYNKTDKNSAGWSEFDYAVKDFQDRASKGATAFLSKGFVMTYEGHVRSTLKGVPDLLDAGFDDERVVYIYALERLLNYFKKHAKYNAKAEKILDKVSK